jgi:fluoride exporter
VRMLGTILLVGLGGAIGAMMRVTLTALVNLAPTGPWKLGTLAVNLLGCFLFGLVWARADLKLQLETPATIALLGGFLGALTTFSTYAFQTAELSRQSDYTWAAANLITQNGLGIAMVFAGIALAKGITPVG